MGQLTSKSSTLTPGFAHYTEWSLDAVNALLHRFERKQRSYGFRVSKRLFFDLFREGSSGSNSKNKSTRRRHYQGAGSAVVPTTEQMWHLWGGKAGEYDSAVDMLEICAGIVCVCRAKFHAKVDALFELFDFDEVGLLNRTGMQRMLTAVLSANGKMYGLDSISQLWIEDAVSSIFHSSEALIKSSRLSPDEIYLWSRSSSHAMVLLNRFGTTDRARVNKRFHLFKKESKLLTGAIAKANSKSVKKKCRFSFSPKHSHREIMNLKILFDSIDVDSTGLVSVDYLKRPKRYTEAFLIRDVSLMFQEEAHRIDPNKHFITFNEMLDILYKDATLEDKLLMQSWVPEPVAKIHVRAIQRQFDRLDLDFSGKVNLQTVLRAIASRATLVPLFHNRKWYQRIEEEIKLEEALEEEAELSRCQPTDNWYENEGDATIDASASTNDVKMINNAHSTVSSHDYSQYFDNKGQSGSRSDRPSSSRHRYQRPQPFNSRAHVLQSSRSNASAPYSPRSVRPKTQYSVQQRQRHSRRDRKVRSRGSNTHRSVPNKNAVKKSDGNQTARRHPRRSPREKRLISPVSARRPSTTGDRTKLSSLNTVGSNPSTSHSSAQRSTLQSRSTRRLETARSNWTIDTGLRRVKEEKETMVNMRELLAFLFAKSHPRQIKKIQSWAKPSKLLTETQQRELCTLFSFYDINNDGTIELNELMKHLQAKGLPESECRELFEDVDVDDDRSISVQEFQIFYRNIWDSHINFKTEHMRVELPRPYYTHANGFRPLVIRPSWIG